MGWLDKLLGNVCPDCGGTNLYLARTSPMEVWACRDCVEKERKRLAEQQQQQRRMQALEDRIRQLESQQED